MPPTSGATTPVTGQLTLAAGVPQTIPTDRAAATRVLVDNVGATIYLDYDQTPTAGGSYPIPTGTPAAPMRAEILVPPGSSLHVMCAAAGAVNYCSTRAYTTTA